MTHNALSLSATDNPQQSEDEVDNSPVEQIVPFVCYIASNNAIVLTFFDRVYLQWFRLCSACHFRAYDSVRLLSFNGTFPLLT